MTKKVLVISYYWPPSGGGGVQRWLKFVKYLPEFGWEPIVFTPENPDFELQDLTLDKDINADLEVIRFPIWEPFGIYKKITGAGKKNTYKQGIVIESSKMTFLQRLVIWVRGNLFLPDPRRFWIKPSVSFLKDYIERESIDIIVTTGPPHSMHLIGKQLKQKTGVKWIADFRDPWSDWDMLDKLNATSLVKSLHRRIERQVMELADVVLTVTPRLGYALQNKIQDQKVRVITNGVDSDDFLNTPDKSHATPKFRLGHMGLLNEIRNPTYLWMALSELSDEVDGFKEDLEILLCGMISDSVMSEAYEAGLKDNLVHLDYISHQDVISYYHHSSLLLLLVNDTDNAKWILPGKLFEYIYSKKNILALGPIESDAHDLLEETQSGKMFEFKDQAGIKFFILDHYQRFKSNTLVDNLMEYTSKIERRELTNQLAKLLDETI